MKIKTFRSFRVLKSSPGGFKIFRFDEFWVFRRFGFENAFRFPSHA